MKLKIISLLVILAVMSVTPMIYMGKFDPIAFFNSLSNIGFADLKNLKPAVAEEKIQVYKWRDENGVMQFSNTPPITGGSAERIEVNTNKNIVDAVKIPVKEKKAVEPQQTVKAPSPYSVSGMKKVMDDAKGVEELLQKRSEEQRKAVGSL